VSSAPVANSFHSKNTMSSGTTPKPQTYKSSSRGRRGSKSRGNSGSSRQTVSAMREPGQTAASASSDKSVTEARIATNPTNTDVDEIAVCWICAEPVKYYSISECDHRTCHVCALRLRALYKKTDCAFCKASRSVLSNHKKRSSDTVQNSQASVIFTASHDALFSSFTPDLIPYKDSRLSIFFETEEMREETFILLRYNCPDSVCDYTATGWSDLKLHVRAIHSKLMWSGTTVLPLAMD